MSDSAQQELARRENSRDRVLALFQAKQVVTNLELNAVCYRYGGRIHELRQQGYDIVTGEKRGGIVHYEYRGLKRLPLLEQSA
jgi:hypothetical protein